MWSCSAMPINKQTSSSAEMKINLFSVCQGCIQIRIALTNIPGATNSSEKRVTLRSNGALLRLAFLLESWPIAGLEPIFFHPPIQRATAQTQCFGSLAHVALKALQGFAD